MKNILLNYIVQKFLKTFVVMVLFFYSFGIILNLFEEIEFFKNLDVNILKPLVLTSVYIPSLIIKILPFIIFISSMWFVLKIRNNRDLLTLKIFGFSNIKIFFILALTSFVIGWLILLLINPITSSMAKYYEKTKSSYSRDIDHLVTVNKNGLWIKENLRNRQRIISSEKIEKSILFNIKIFHFDENFNLEEKIVAKQANIENNTWYLKDVLIFSDIDDVTKTLEFKDYEIESIYNYEKITNLFKNFDTMSFLDLILKREKLINNGYNNIFLDQSLHTLLSLPFFLMLMTAIASILTLNTLKKSDNLKFIIIGLIVIVLVFYFKDLSIALGQTDRIPLILSIWAPIIALSLFTFIGILQINEK